MLNVIKLSAIMLSVMASLISQLFVFWQIQKNINLIFENL
jgi:hypothetical protein